MKYVCFAASPLHLMCIKEIAIRHEESSFVIYCLVQDRSDVLYKQMVRTIEILNLNNVREVLVAKNIIFNRLMNLILAGYLYYKFKGQLTTFVILDFRNTSMHFLRRLFFTSRFILIDDGYATCVSYQNYIKHGYFLPFQQYKGVKGRFNKFIHYGSSYCRLLYKPFDLFTIYAKELGLSEDSYNDLSFVSKFTRSAELSYSDQLVYFAGSRLAEKGVSSMEEEIKLIGKINDYWAERGKKMTYVGKRVGKDSKSEIKMNLIEKESIPVIFFDLPLELALVDSKLQIMPSAICSFGSTLNTTLPLLHPEMDAYLVEIINLKEAQIEVKKV